MAKPRPDHGAERDRRVRREPGREGTRRPSTRRGRTAVSSRSGSGTSSTAATAATAAAERQDRVGSALGARQADGRRAAGEQGNGHQLTGQGLDQARASVAAEQLVQEARHDAAGRGQSQPVQERVVPGEPDRAHGEDRAEAEGSDGAPRGRQVQQHRPAPDQQGRTRPAARRPGATTRRTPRSPAARRRPAPRAGATTGRRPVRVARPAPGSARSSAQPPAKGGRTSTVSPSLSTREGAEISPSTSSELTLSTSGERGGATGPARAPGRRGRRHRSRLLVAAGRLPGARPSSER